MYYVSCYKLGGVPLPKLQDDVFDSFLLVSNTVLVWDFQIVHELKHRSSANPIDECKSSDIDIVWACQGDIYCLIAFKQVDRTLISISIVSVP